MTGSAGGKAESRRPDMGRALSEYADKVYLTSDDPNFEDPRANRCRDSRCDHCTYCQLLKNQDGTAALRSNQRVAEAASQDIVILAGKGAEQYLKAMVKKNLMKVICKSLSAFCLIFSLPSPIR